MDLVYYIVSATESFGFWGYMVAFLFAFLESLAFVGGFIPGSTAVVLLGFMCSRGYLNIYVLMFVTILGAVLGDSASYWLGTKGTHFFKKGNRFLKASHLEMGQRFFQKHGNKSIFLGRFIGIIRPMIPFAAGLSRMDYKIFLFWNVFSGIVWGASHIYIGYFFGGAFKLIEAWSKRVSVLLLILVLVALAFWLLARAFSPTISYIGRLIRSAADYLLDTRSARSFIRLFPNLSAFIGMRFGNRDFFGWPLTLLIVLASALVTLFAMIAEGILDADAVTELDSRVAFFLAFFRDALLIKAFTWTSLPGKPLVIFFFILMFTLGILLWFRRRMAWPFIASACACQMTVWFIKEAFNRPRPAGVIPVYLERTQSFPSEYSAMAVVFYGFISYFLIRVALKERPRLSIWMIFVSLLAVSLVGFSRLYLGVNYFSDVMGGYLIGGICLLAGIGLSEWILQGISGRPDAVHPGPPLQRRLLAFLLLAVSIAVFVLYGMFFHRPEMIRGRELLTSMVLTPKIPSNELFSFNKWPNFSAGLTGRKREPIIFLAWAKDDEQLKKAFLMADWKIPDQPSVKNMLRMGLAAAGGRQYDTAPVAPAFWLNQSNDFAFEKTMENTVPRKRCVRFWKTNLVDSSGKILYLGASGKTQMQGSLDIPTERNLVIEELNSTGMVLSFTREKISSPISAKKAFAVRYHTDGAVVVLYLK